MSVADTSLGWQDMRQQLFGQQRQRAVESRLTRALGEVHQRIARATRGGVQSPKQRGKVLSAVLEGVNQLICWHHDEVTAERAAGEWTQPVPQMASELLGEVRAAYPMYEGATVAGGTLDCADVVQAIAYLRGEESDRFFNEVLAGATALLGGVFERIANDEPTAGAAATLSDAWEALLADIEALAAPVVPAANQTPADDPAAPRLLRLLVPEAVGDGDTSEAADVADDAAEPVTTGVPDGANSADVLLAAMAEELEAEERDEVDERETLLPEPLPLRLSTAASVLERLETATAEAPVVVPDTEVAPDAAPLAGVMPILAARFSRIQLVAC